jgi:hypothetical protein
MSRRLQQATFPTMGPLLRQHIDAGLPLVGRRHFIGGLAVVVGGVTVGACGGGGSDVQLSASRLFDTRALRTDGTPQRMVWALSDIDGYVTSTAPDTISVTAVQNDVKVLDSVIVDIHRDGMLVPYYPVEMVFADSSPVEFTFDADGTSFTSFVDARGVAGDGLVGAGDPMLPVATPILGNTRGSDPLCTRSPEPCPFHAISLDDALRDGRPTIVNISTPAFCGNQVACGPALEVLVEESPNISSEVAIIHTEVYVTPTGSELGPVAPIMDATGLWFEPALYVINSDGTVATRLDFMWDRPDLQTAIASLT